MANPINLEADKWDSEVNQSKLPVLVDFWHDACIWCRRLEPFFNELSEEFSDQLKFAKLNTLSSEENNELAGKFGVMGTPTMILFCQGRPIQSLVGYRPKEALRDELKRMIETYNDCFRQQTPVK